MKGTLCSISAVIVGHIYSLWEGLYKRYCTLLGVILHIAKAGMAWYC